MQKGLLQGLRDEVPLKDRGTTGIDHKDPSSLLPSMHVHRRSKTMHACPSKETGRRSSCTPTSTRNLSIYASSSQAHGDFDRTTVEHRLPERMFTDYMFFHTYHLPISRIFSSCLFLIQNTAQTKQTILPRERFFICGRKIRINMFSFDNESNDLYMTIFIITHPNFSQGIKVLKMDELLRQVFGSLTSIISFREHL